MGKCRVAIVHNIIAPYRIPIFEELGKNPLIDLKVFYCTETHSERNWEVNACETYDYTILPGTCVQVGHIRYHVNPSIVRELLRGNYDVVIIGGCTDFTTQMAFVASKILDLPVILWSEAIKEAESRLGKLIMPISKYIISHASAVLVPGSRSRDYHIMKGAHPDAILIAHNIVDNERLINTSHNFWENRTNIKEELKLDGKKVVVFFGQLIQRKGVNYLIDAFKLLQNEFNDVCLLIGGDGVQRITLEEHCIQNGIKNVYFLGWQSETNKIKYCSIADVFVLPTLEDLCPLVLNEAMCCKLPVVSTLKAGCAHDMVRASENGFIVRDKSAKELYVAMKTILSNDELRAQMGETSLDIIKTEYNVGNTVESFVEAILRVVHKKNFK